MVAEAVTVSDISYIRLNPTRERKIRHPAVPASIREVTSLEEAIAYVTNERGKYWDGKSCGVKIPHWEANAHLRQRLGAELNTLFEESGDDSSVGQIIDWYIQAITLHVPLIDSPATQGLKETTAESFIRERQEILASRGLISSATVKPTQIKRTAVNLS
ncbi:MAG: hypothetical protein AAB801_02060 [Patescibacteria group bacterium]